MSIHPMAETGAGRAPAADPSSPPDQGGPGPTAESLRRADIQGLQDTYERAPEHRMLIDQVAPEVLLAHNLRPLVPIVRRIRPGGDAAIAPRYPRLQTYARAQRYLSLGPALLGHRAAQAPLPEPRGALPPTALSAAVLSGSGNLAVFRPERLDLYDLGNPGRFDFGAADHAQVMAPSYSVPFQGISTPLQDAVVSPTGRLLAVVTHFQRAIVFDLHDNMRQLGQVMCALGTHLTFGDNDRLLIVQSPTGVTTLHPLWFGQGRLCGAPQVLGLGQPVQDITRASVSLDGMHLVVVSLGPRSQASVYRRHHKPDGAWDLIERFDNVVDAWLCHHDNTLALHHSGGMVTLRTVQGAAVSRAARMLPGRLLALSPESSTAVMFDDKRQRLLLRQWATGHSVDVGACAGLTLSPEGPLPAVSYSATGLALLIHQGLDVYVVRHVTSPTPEILRPLDAREPGSLVAAIAPAARPVLTQGGEFVLTTAHQGAARVAVYGLGDVRCLEAGMRWPRLATPSDAAEPSLSAVNTNILRLKKMFYGVLRWCQQFVHRLLWPHKAINTWLPF